MAELVDLDEPPQRIEIYDNSHIQGTNALGAMVVAGPEGWIQGAYRKFNIKRAESQHGDDFALTHDVLQRRFARALAAATARPSTAWADQTRTAAGREGGEPYGKIR